MRGGVSVMEGRPLCRVALSAHWSDFCGFLRLGAAGTATATDR